MITPPFSLPGFDISYYRTAELSYYHTIILLISKAILSCYHTRIIISHYHTIVLYCTIHYHTSSYYHTIIHTIILPYHTKILSYCNSIIVSYYPSIILSYNPATLSYSHEWLAFFVSHGQLDLLGFFLVAMRSLSLLWFIPWKSKE